MPVNTWPQTSTYVLAIRRIHRRAIAAGIGGDLLGSPACYWHEKDVVVGAGGLHLVDVAGEGNLLPIRRKLILVLPAQAERRHIVSARRQVARHAPIGRDQKQVAVLAIGVVVPVAKHQLGKDPGLHLRLGLLLVVLLIARIVLAIGIYEIGRAHV